MTWLDPLQVRCGCAGLMSHRCDNGFGCIHDLIIHHEAFAKLELQNLDPEHEEIPELEDLQRIQMAN